MLLNEIIFLKNQCKKCESDQRKWIEVALEKLEYLLNMLKNNEQDVTEEDFNSTIMIVYDIFREITNNI